MSEGDYWDHSERTGAPPESPRLWLPDDARDFAECHGDTDLDEALEDLEREAHHLVAGGMHDVERVLGAARER
jgi:hypothetical protein